MLREYCTHLCQGCGFDSRSRELSAKDFTRNFKIMFAGGHEELFRNASLDFKLDDELDVVMRK